MIAKIHYVKDGDLPNPDYPIGKYKFGYVVWAQGWMMHACYSDGKWWSNGEEIYPVAWFEPKPPKRVVKYFKEDRK